MSAVEARSGVPVPDTFGVNPNWRRLSRKMLLVHPVQEIPRSIPAIIALFFAGSANGHVWFGLIGLVLVVVLGVVRWFTTTYRITPEQVQIRRGLLRRREISAARDRIRTVDVTAHAIHRVLGLARVTIGTGMTDRKGSDFRLDGLTTAEAARLRVELLHLRPSARPAHSPSTVDTEPAAEAGPRSEPDETVLAKLQPGWIRYGPFTLSGFLTIGVLGAFVSRIVNEAHIDPTSVGPTRTIVRHLQDVPLGVAVIEVVITVLIFVAIASTAGYVLAFWGFKLTRHQAGTLHITRGLITSRATTIEERRLRGAELSEPFSLRAVGGARCLAIATGLRVGRGAERGGSVLLPPAPSAEARRIAGLVLGNPAPFEADLVKHGPRATQRRFTRALGAAVLLIAVVVGWRYLIDGPAWMWQAALVLLPIAALLGWDRAGNLGHALSGRWLVARQGSFIRRRYVLATDGIIGWNISRSFFQRRAGLLTLTATTAGGRQRYEVPDVDVPEGIRLADAAVPGLLTPFLEH